MRVFERYKPVAIGEAWFYPVPLKYVTKLRKIYVYLSIQDCDHSDPKLFCVKPTNILTSVGFMLS